MSLRICILTPAALGSNPRVVKEAAALSEAGHTVRVVCKRIMEGHEFLDLDVAKSASWRTHRIDLSKARCRVPARLLQMAMGVGFDITRGSAFASRGISALAPALVTRARAEPADLFIAHYPSALPAAAEAARFHKAHYAFDAEDFHFGETPDDRRYEKQRQMIQAIEQYYLPYCTYVTAASPGIAAAYAEKYNIEKPHVILNVFPRAEAPDYSLPFGSCEPRPSVYWFSQTIGPDRGLECAVRAIARARTRPHLYLRGTPAYGYIDYLQSIADDAGSSRQLHILPPAPPSEMARIASTYDVGLAAEPGHTLNNQLALSNKLFTYLLAGIPTILSDTPAHRAFVSTVNDACSLYPAEDPNGLASALDAAVAGYGVLAASRQAAFEHGRRRFNWNLEKEALLQVVETTT